ncbi:RNA polymerase sigma factor, sigma-70 family [[Clostridium] lactatifermentans DSM 14214]|uniref:RNA polymerase sigma factor, sigma-70 family n=1 Tax=Anaerotignum lactatifermentans DSM 14214 TaxID=1121323 RepID=A0A1M6XU38_9FIRM|nr:sigma factor-like helix-turn-helix DNA-binding protein [Anaerotignum lactatifermentans]SHL09530.1 RNA polymerase sigma factor, sigma-70 family [[Clostridium] lactatifermentans DSM 14214] [Anaerotignum lactatifermentans DSM 14214]
MCKKSEKQYFVQVGNRQVEVNHEVYLEIYKDYLYEKNQERKRRRYNVLSLDAMNEENNNVYDFVPDLRSNTEEEAIHEVTIHKIKEILKEIDKDNIILLKYLHEYSESEIAAVLGISQAAVSKKMQKVMEILRSFVL